MFNLNSLKQTTILPCLLLLLGVLLFGCASRRNQANSSGPTPPGNQGADSGDAESNQTSSIFNSLPDSSKQTLRIKPNDVISINLAGEDWGGSFTVPSTGTIQLQYIGSVDVKGLTINELEAKLRNKLTPDYFLQPDITANFQKIAPVRVLVMGSVGQPSHVDIRRDEGVMDALVEAGYLTRNSERTKMYIFRKDGDDTAVYHANYERYARGDLRQNVPLKEDDLVYVRTNFWPHFDTLQHYLQAIGFAAGTARNVRQTDEAFESD